MKKLIFAFLMFSVCYTSFSQAISCGSGSTAWVGYLPGQTGNSCANQCPGGVVYFKSPGGVSGTWEVNNVTYGTPGGTPYLCLPKASYYNVTFRPNSGGSSNCLLYWSNCCGSGSFQEEKQPDQLFKQNIRLLKVESKVEVAELFRLTSDNSIKSTR